LVLSSYCEPVSKSPRTGSLGLQCAPINQSGGAVRLAVLDLAVSDLGS